LQGAYSASCHFDRIVLALKIIGDLDRLRQCAGNVWPHDFTEQTFVRVKVQIEKARQHQAAASVDDIAGRRDQIRAHGSNSFAFDCDVQQLILVSQPGIANKHIHLIPLVDLFTVPKITFRQPPCISCSARGT
jgi:hypothetical protein